MSENIIDVNPKILIPRQTPSEMSQNKIKRLRKKIKNNGFDRNQPVKVAKIENQLIIIDVHHRVEASKKLRLSEIPIMIEVVSDSQSQQFLMDVADAQKYNGDY